MNAYFNKSSSLQPFATVQKVCKIKMFAKLEIRGEKNGIIKSQLVENLTESNSS